MDIAQWPILIVVLGAEDDEGLVERSLKVIEELYENRREPFVTIIDATSGRRLTPAERYSQTEFRRKHEDHIKEYSRGTALVFNSEILKAVVTAMHWLKPPDNVTKTFTDMDSATAWAKERLET